jgi:hypothetical protein|tara:strand:- start:134 stop:298 length:165 start_codon:yes stop_codon:yes gene_type:complete
MDKFGWQRPNLEPGKTLIETACQMKAMRKRAEQVEVVAAGNVLARLREREMMGE